MTEILTVYAYNVLFGDAILVEVPDGGRPRFILIDVGNARSGPGGEDQALLDTVDRIIDRTGGHIDLYIMTHEHLDHVQGLLLAKTKGRDLHIDTVWMTSSASPNYYEQHPEAEKKRLALLEAEQAFRALLGASEQAGELAGVLAINSASKTADCVDHIRQAGAARYLHRGAGLEGLQTLAKAKLRILAPEEDTSVYYQPVTHLALADGGSAVALARPLPLPGVDGGAFYELIDRMDGGLAESLFAIDQAANNTSLVVELTWRGRRLLFAGDAEQRSWQMMADKADLQAVDLLKVGHHGSHNGTPPAPILDLVLPRGRRRTAVAIVSTHPGVYGGVPDPRTLDELDLRTSRVYRTTEVNPGAPVVVSFTPRR